MSGLPSTASSDEVGLRLSDTSTRQDSINQPTGGVFKQGRPTTNMEVPTDQVECLTGKEARCIWTIVLSICYVRGEYRLVLHYIFH